MCVTCGCGGTAAQGDGSVQAHDHGHGHGHDHHHPTADGGTLHFGQGAAGHGAAGTSQARLIAIETSVLARNAAFADANRLRLREMGWFGVNLMSSPGSGKTTLLCATLRAMTTPKAVIEGDQQTANDANRIRETGAPAVQINTGKGCHLDAHMVGHAIDHLPATPGTTLFIENVGNLVCPAAFDLGEAARVVLFSVTEGEDKPLKYPDMFTSCELALLCKVDLAPHCDVDLDLCEANLRRVNPRIAVIRVSARTGVGMDAWLAWLAERARTASATQAAE